MNELAAFLAGVACCVMVRVVREGWRQVVDADWRLACEEWREEWERRRREVEKQQQAEALKRDE